MILEKKSLEKERHEINNYNLSSFGLSCFLNDAGWHVLLASAWNLRAHSSCSRGSIYVGTAAAVSHICQQKLPFSSMHLRPAQIWNLLNSPWLWMLHKGLRRFSLFSISVFFDPLKITLVLSLKLKKGQNTLRANLFHTSLPMPRSSEQKVLLPIPLYSVVQLVGICWRSCGSQCAYQGHRWGSWVH